jgi:DNA-binding MurR/RpiR family transcriptional regulator
MSKSSPKKSDAALIPEVVEPTLSRRHEAVIVALLANPKMKDAAVHAGVSEATVWRLMQREDFQRRYREAQEKAFDGALGTLQGAAMEAIATLQRNLSCRVPAAEVQAAKTLLDFTLKAREQFDHAARIRALEAALKAREEADRRRGEKEDEDDGD